MACSNSMIDHISRSSVSVPSSLMMLNAARHSAISNRVSSRAAFTAFSKAWRPACLGVR